MLQNSLPLQPSSACLTTCPGLANATSEMNDASASLGNMNFQAPMTQMISTMCSYQSDFTCMMQACAPDAAATAAEILGLLDCLCTDCPTFGAVHAALPGLVQLMQSGNANSQGLIAEMCSYVGPLTCLATQSSCIAHSSSANNVDFFSMITALGPNCTEMGLSTGVNDALTTSSGTTLVVNIKDSAAECFPRLMLLCLFSIGLFSDWM